MRCPASRPPILFSEKSGTADRKETFRLNHKLSQLFQPSVQLYFACLFLFALISASYSLPLAAIELAVVVVLALYSRTVARRQKRELAKYLDSVAGSADAASQDSAANTPLPMIIFRPDTGEIIWTNDRFLQITNRREHLYDAKLSTLIPGFDIRWLKEGKERCPEEVEYEKRRFLVFGQLVRTGEKGKGGGFLAATYWVEVTELSRSRELFLATKPVCAVLLLDNYEDLTKNLTENIRSQILSEIDSRLDEWVQQTGGILRRYERERYLYLFEEQYLPRFIEQKFDILNTIRQVHNPSGIEATLSIGIGKDGDSFQELLSFAELSVDMALSRGGDQAVIRNRFTFEFYGGRSKETEKRTKVKSRVMANALSSLVSDSSHVFIMGHRAPDNDAVGAASGICALCRKNGTPAHIIRESSPSPAKALYERLARAPEYADSFLTAQEALLIADTRSLCVVVDTNRPEQVQAQELLQSCNRVAVIDHHRRAATYIEGAALNYHEPYASSASELVTELLQYTMEPNQLLRVEAEALLAGIMLDTKNFTMRTGSRTFEAAAFLRRSGADTGEVKKLYQNDLAGTIAKYSLIQNAKLYRNGIAIAVSDRVTDRVTAAQACDELLNIIGSDTSFVISTDGERVNMSGRSQGSVNVQVVLEALGGGGNAAAAGGQVSGKSVQEVASQLTHAIDHYLDA